MQIIIIIIIIIIISISIIIIIIITIIIINYYYCCHCCCLLNILQIAVLIDMISFLYCINNNDCEWHNVSVIFLHVWLLE